LGRSVVRIGYMAKVRGEKTLNVDLPETLYEELDGLAALFPPFKKKHVVMAAIGAFVAKGRDAQMQTILDAQQRYYWKAHDEVSGATVSDDESPQAGDGTRAKRIGEAATVELQKLRRRQAKSAAAKKRSPRRRAGDAG